MFRLIAVCVLSLASATTVLAGEAAAVSRSLCRAEEQVIFSCPVAKAAKLVSLCGSKNLDNRRGYLQYRFGKPGAVELQFPGERANTQLAFRYAHYFRAQVDRIEVTFDHNGYRYVIFDYRESDVKPPIREAGVRVHQLGNLARQNENACSAGPNGKLGALQNVIPRDADNSLNQ